MTDVEAATSVLNRPSGDGWYDVPRDPEAFAQFCDRVQDYLARAREDTRLDNLWALYLNQALGEIAWLRAEKAATPVPSGPTVYVASKSRFGPLWQEARDAWADLGLRVVSTWIDEYGEGESTDLTDLWTRCVDEVRAADFLVAVHTDGDEWKGAYVEIGGALTLGKPVYICGRPPCSVINHPLITLCSDPDDAIEDWRAFHLRAEWPGRDNTDPPARRTAADGGGFEQRPADHTDPDPHRVERSP